MGDTELLRCGGRNYGTIRGNIFNELRSLKHALISVYETLMDATQKSHLCILICVLQIANIFHISAWDHQIKRRLIFISRCLVLAFRNVPMWTPQETGNPLFKKIVKWNQNLLELKAFTLKKFSRLDSLWNVMKFLKMHFRNCNWLVYVLLLYIKYFINKDKTYTTMPLVEPYNPICKSDFSEESRPTHYS